MLTSSLLSALAITAVTPTPWACDLAPSLGRGSSDEGRIDSISTLNFGCRYQVFNILGVGISPQIGLDKQLWTVYQKNSLKKDMSTYETEGYSFGVRFETDITSHSTVYYGLSAGQGKGSLKLTQSTDQSALSSTFSNVKNSYLQHSLGSSYALTENLSLTFALQRQIASQNWSYSRSDILMQNVDEANSLTLTEGTTALLGLEKTPRTRNHTTASLLQVGLSFQFGN